MFILTAAEPTKVTPRFVLMAFPVSEDREGGDLEPWEISDPFFLFLLPLLRKICEMAKAIFPAVINLLRIRIPCSI
jgi:hypothetical protein